MVHALEHNPTKRSLNPYGSVVFFLGLALYKMRGHLLHGRLWAEEGSVFFSQIAHLNIWKSLLYIFNGHLEFITNVLVLVATRAPLAYAPIFTMYGSLIIQIATFALLVKKRQEFQLANWALYMLAIIMTGLPQATEVWGNSINIHFHMALAASIVLATAPGSMAWRNMSRGILLAAGLSGIPANFLSPIAIIQAVRLASHEHRIRAAILVSSTLLQITLLTHTTPSGNRTLTTNPLVYWLSIVSQELISPLIPSNHLSNQLISLIRPALDGSPLPILASLLLSFVALLSIILQLKQAPHAPIVTMLCSGLLLSVLCIAVSLGHKEDLISAAGHGRYFYIPNVLMAIFVLWAASTPRPHKLAVSIAICLTVACCARLSSHASGTNWTDGLKASTGSGVIAIMPDGWSMPHPDASK